MIYAVTCADDNYMPSAQFQMETAKKYGKVDRAIIYNLKDINSFKKIINRFFWLEEKEEKVAIFGSRIF